MERTINRLHQYRRLRVRYERRADIHEAFLALADVADYIVTFYNRTRRHGHLGGVSPEQFEAAHKVRSRGVH